MIAKPTMRWLLGALVAVGACQKARTDEPTQSDEEVQRVRGVSEVQYSQAYGGDAGVGVAPTPQASPTFSGPDGGALQQQPQYVPYVVPVVPVQPGINPNQNLNPNLNQQNLNPNL